MPRGGMSTATRVGEVRGHLFAVMWAEIWAAREDAVATETGPRSGRVGRVIVACNLPRWASLGGFGAFGSLGSLGGFGECIRIRGFDASGRSGEGPSRGTGTGSLIVRSISTSCQVGSGAGTARALAERGAGMERSVAGESSCVSGSSTTGRRLVVGFVRRLRCAAAAAP